MLTKRSFSLLSACVVVALALMAHAAVAQCTVATESEATAPETDTAAVAQPPATSATSGSAAISGRRPVALGESRLRPERRPVTPAPVTARPATSSTTAAQTVINNTNLMIVNPGYSGYYGGVRPYYPWYPPRPTYRFYDRGLYNGMMGPFGLSGFRPLRVTTIP